MSTLNEALVWIANGDKTKRIGWNPRMVAYDFGFHNHEMVAYLVKIEEPYVLNDRDKNASDWIKFN